MPTIYKINYPKADRPIKQEVDKVGHPNLDADGETQYVNTHFENEGEAWEALVRELEACLFFNTREIKKAMEELQAAKDTLTETAILLDNAKSGMNYFRLTNSQTNNTQKLCKPH